MPSANETRAQVARESERRRKLAVPAFAGGALYVLSGVIIQAAVSGAPNVGIVQGLTPALHGEAKPRVSPRAAEVKFISHHAFALIAGSALAAIAIGALVLALLLLFDAARFRRAQSWSAARPLVLAGGVALALVSIANQVLRSIRTHEFAVGHDFSSHAVDYALTKGSAYLTLDYLDLLAGVSLAAGTIATSLNAMRVGLLPRWMGILGIFTAVLIFLPGGGAILQVVPGFWMVMLGILFIGRWPNGDPPAWAEGEARPWPSQARTRPPRDARKQPAGAEPEEATADVAPAPVRPTDSRSARRRRRKRGAKR
jgi:hypothetical protein